MSEVLKQILNISDVLKKDFPGIEKNLKTFAAAAVDCAKSQATPWEKQTFQVFNKVAACIRK